MRDVGVRVVCEPAMLEEAGAAIALAEDRTWQVGGISSRDVWALGPGVRVPAMLEAVSLWRRRAQTWHAPVL
jgi:hypothetical protein